MAEIIWVILALAVHLIYLFRTTFVDFPELLIYPWYIHQGMVPYRDFIIPYTPALNYLLYPIYLLLGFSPQSERIIAYTAILATDVTIYFLVKHLTRNRWAALVSMIFFVFWQPIYAGNTLWHETIMTPIFLVVFWLVIRHRANPSFRRAVIIGILLALLTLMKQTTLLFVLVTMVFIGLPYALVIAAIVGGSHAIVWSVFALLGIGKEYVFWTVGFLLQLFKNPGLYRDLPSRGDLFLILPSLVPLIFLRNRFLIGIIAVLGLFAFPRWDLFRLQPMLGFIAVDVGFIFSKVRYKSWMLFLIILVIVASLRSMKRFIMVYDPMQPTFFTKEYQTLVDFTKKNVDGPYAALGAVESVYFGTLTRPVIPVMPLFPWYATVPGYQQSIIDHLERASLRYVLYAPFEPSPEQLTLYLTQKYEKIAPLPGSGGWLYRRK